MKTIIKSTAARSALLGSSGLTRVTAQPATPRAKDASFAYPARIDRRKPIAPQMTAAILAIHRVFGDCQAKDLQAVGFTAAEIADHGRTAALLAYRQAPEVANDVQPHLSDEDIAAGLKVA